MYHYCWKDIKSEDSSQHWLMILNGGGERLAEIGIFINFQEVAAVMPCYWVPLAMLVFPLIRSKKTWPISGQLGIYGGGGGGECSPKYFFPQVSPEITLIIPNLTILTKKWHFLHDSHLFLAHLIFSLAPLAPLLPPKKIMLVPPLTVTGNIMVGSCLNGSQLTKMKKIIHDMFLPYNL